MKELISVYKPTKKALETVDEIFTQGDGKYADPGSHVVTAGFIANGALSITSKILNSPKTLDIPIKGPQKDLKGIVAHLLKERGFDVRFEVSITGGRPDIIGTKGKEQILVECGPCRVDKPVQYLKKPNTILWVVKPSPKGIILYEISRGGSWDTFHEFHIKQTIEDLKCEVKKLGVNR